MQERRICADTTFLRKKHVISISKFDIGFGVGQVWNCQGVALTSKGQSA